MTDVDEKPVRKRHHLPRECYQGGDTFFITVCTAERQTILTTEPLCGVLVSFLETLKDTNDGPVHAYVVMPDHLHVLLSGSDDVISWMRWFKARVTFHAKKKGCAGEIWQRGFYDEGVRKIEKSREILRYMSDNPVEAGLVERPGEWPHKWGC
ncbi:MAG: transposase [Deltaproteobacteria bacterium]|nr:transposase [Deltaproteobacteria bacterium]